MGEIVLFRHFVRPAPVQRHVFVHGPDIGGADCFRKFLLLGDFGRIGVFCSANAENGLHIGCIFLQNLVETDKEIRYLLIGGTFVKGEPVSGSFMVQAEHHASESTQVFRNRNNVLIRYMGVAGQGQYNILSMASDIAHAGKSLPVHIAVQSASEGEIIVVRIIPCKADFFIGISILCSCGPCFVQRVIAVHQVDASVRSVKLLQDIILVHIKSSFAAVA